VTYNPDFKITIIQRQITRKWCIIELYLQWPTNRRPFMICRMAPFSMTFKDHGFKVTPFFDAEYLINGTTYKHSFNEILIGTYTCPTQQCHFEWPWVILSDLAKYSTTRSVARFRCDSWASCCLGPAYIGDVRSPPNLTQWFLHLHFRIPSLVSPPGVIENLWRNAPIDGKCLGYNLVVHRSQPN